MANSQCDRVARRSHRRALPALARRSALTVFVVGVLVVVSCSRQAPPPAMSNQSASQAAPLPANGTRQENRPPVALVQIGESSVALFNAARTAKWADAAVSVRTLKEAVAALSLPAPKPDLSAQLKSRIRDLEDSVKERQQVQSMDVANSMTRLVAELSASYQDELPYKIMLLDYYGRQLELGVAASQPATLKQAAADLRQTWNSIEPSVLRRGRVDDARQFTDIVVQLEGAKVPGDYIAPVRAELAAADRLETMFRQ